MEHDVTAAVDEYRHGVQNRALEVQRLQDMVVGLESEGDRAVRPRALAASLRHARRDLAAAERALDELRHDYARFRLREALGHDPDHLDDRAVDEELLAISVNSFSRKENRYPLAGAIGFETFRELLLAGLPLGQLIENERARHKNDIIFDAPGDETATKTILRQWAARTHPDPYVSDLLRRAAMATSIYDDSLAAFQRALNDLRVNYEIRQRDADSVVFSFEGNTPVIQASNAWENIERVFPEQARRLAADQPRLSTGASLVVLDRLIHRGVCPLAGPHEHRDDSAAAAPRDLCPVDVGVRTVPAKQVDQQVRLDAAEAAPLTVAPVRCVHQLTRAAQGLRVVVANTTRQTFDKLVCPVVFVNVVLRPRSDLVHHARIDPRRRIPRLTESLEKLASFDLRRDSVAEALYVIRYGNLR